MDTRTRLPALSLLCLSPVLLTACPGSRPGAAPGESSGAPTFAKSYGGPGSDDAALAVPTHDGGSFLVGTANGQAESEVDANLWVARLDAYGDIVWERELGEENPFNGNWIRYTELGEGPDGSVWLAGKRNFVQHTGDPYADGGNVMLLKLDAQGSPIWESEYDLGAPPPYQLAAPDTTAEEEPTDIWPTADGGALVAVQVSANVLERIPTSNGRRIRIKVVAVFKVDAAGNQVWSTHVTDNGDEEPTFPEDMPPHLVCETEDGGALAVAHWSDLNRKFMTRFASGGGRFWTKERTGIDGNVRGISPLPGDRYLVHGGGIQGAEATVFTADPADVDDDLDVVWSRSYAQYQSFKSYAGRGMVSTAGGTPEVGYGFVASAGAAAEVALVDANGTPLVDAPIGDIGLSARFDPATDRWRTLAWNEAAEQIQLAEFRPDLTALGTTATMPQPDEPRYTGVVEASNGDVLLSEVFGIGGTELRRLDSNLAAAFVEHSGIGSRRIERGQCVIAVDADGDGRRDDGCLVLASTVFTETENRGTETWMLRFSADGRLLWERWLRGANLHGRMGVDLGIRSMSRLRNEAPADNLVQRPDGTYAVVATIGRRVHVMTFDDQGSLLRVSEAIDPEGDVAVATCLRASTNGDLLVGGIATLSSRWLARLDRELAFQWGFTTRVGGRESLSFDATADGGLAAEVDGTLVRMDAAGTVLWAKRYPHPGQEFSRATRVVALDDGGFALGGTIGTPSYDATGDLIDFSDPSTGRENFGLLRVDRTGEPGWYQIYGALFHEQLQGLRALEDGGFLLAGRSWSMGELEEMWLVRTGPDGVVSGGCNAGLVSEPWPGSSVAAVPRLVSYVPSSASAATVGVEERGLTGRPFAGLVVARQCSGFANATPPAPPAGGPGFTLTIVHEGGATGLVTSAPAGLECGTVCVATFPAGTAVRLTPTPTGGAVFSHWEGCDEDFGRSGCVVNMTSDRTVKVWFE